MTIANGIGKVQEIEKGRAPFDLAWLRARPFCAFWRCVLPLRLNALALD
jgi:hypothetical protein